MNAAAASTGRKAATRMIAVLLVLGFGMAVAHYAINVKASDTVATQKVVFEGKDVVTTADAHKYSASVLDVKLAAATTDSSSTEALLNQRAAFQKADTLSRLANAAGTGYRACLVVGAVLMVAMAGSIARRAARRPVLKAAA